MAPFKLKFRMSSSRNTSQEHDTDQQVAEALLPHHQSNAIEASNSTIDSNDCNSLVSLSNNERKYLLPHKTSSLPLGYLNRCASQEESITSVTDGTLTAPTTPPPLYELIAGKNSFLEKKLELQRQQALSASNEGNYDKELTNSGQNIQKWISDTDSQESTFAKNNFSDNLMEDNNKEGNDQHQQHQTDNKAAELFSQIPTTMTSFHGNTDEMENCACQVENCDGASIECTCTCTDANCERADGTVNQASEENAEQLGAYNAENNNCDGTNDMTNSHRMGYCSEEAHYGNEFYQQTKSDHISGSQCGSNWNISQSCNYDDSQHDTLQETEIMSNKSSKEIYKDLAKQWGITCKMTDGCRCMDCQSHYFDCDFDDNEHQKTDGGLGAGTPMFLSEVMHGSACTIL